LFFEALLASLSSKLPFGVTKSFPRYLGRGRLPPLIGSSSSQGRVSSKLDSALAKKMAQKDEPFSSSSFGMCSCKQGFALALSSVRASVHTSAISSKLYGARFGVD
jgi:hypothetical protein